MSEGFRRYQRTCDRMPTLRQPTEEKPFILYLAVEEKAISPALVLEDDRGQQCSFTMLAGHYTELSLTTPS